MVFVVKVRLVAGGHVVNASEYESYASVVHTRTVRLLMTIAANEGLTLITGDIGNAFLHAKTKEKIYSVAGKEFGYRQKCVLVIKKALYGLATSARAWSLELGDTFREMGFSPSRADPDLWIKQNVQTGKYEYIATYVDDVKMVGNEPELYLNIIKSKYPV